MAKGKILDVHFPMNKHFRRCKLYTLMFLALPGVCAHAQNIYDWTGAVNNVVGAEPGNWVLSGSDPSILMDIGVINSNTSITGDIPTLTLDNASNLIYVAPAATVDTLRIGQGSGSNGAFNIKIIDYDSSSPAWRIDLQQLYVGVQGGRGEVNIYHNDTYNEYSSAMVLSVSGADGLLIGSGTGAQGTVNILGSGKTTDMQRDMMATMKVSSGGSGSNIAIGQDGGRGVLNVDGASIDFQTYDSILVLGSGAGSQGNMNVLGGGKASHNMMGSSGQDEISVIIGNDSGHGVMNISGRSLHNGALSRAVMGVGVTVGRGSGSLGEVYVTQGAELSTAEGSYYDVISGSMMHTQNQLGVDGGSGYAVVDGIGSIWKVIGTTYFSGGAPGEIGQLYVGQSGVGEITVSNGGKLSIGQSEYGNTTEYDPVTGASKYYYHEQMHTGGLGTLYLGVQAGSTGTINIGAPAGQVAQGVGVLDVKDIQFGDGTGVIVFNHTDNTGGYVFNTPLISGSGQGVIRQVAGTTVLADQPTYTGDISVEGGKLAINGTQTINEGVVSGGVLEVSGNYIATNTQVTGGYFELFGNASGPITVSGTGTLSGNGKAGDVVVNAGGTVAPGELLGTALNILTVDSVIFNSGSVYQANSNPDHTSDLLYATSANGGSGTATINGGHVNVIAIPGRWEEQTKYEIIATDEGITGQFDGVTSNLAFLEPTLEYDDKSAYLYLARNSTGFGEVGGSYNEINTGWGVGTLVPGHPVYGSVVSMSAEQSRIFYNNLSGEIHADVQSALLLNSRYAREAVNSHLGSYTQRAEEPNRNLWIDAWGHNGHVKSDSNAERFDHKGFGFLIGSDLYSTGITTIGVAAGYEHNKVDVGGIRASEADIDSVHVMVYGRTAIGQVDIKGGVGYTYSSIDTSRKIVVPSVMGDSQADYHGDSVQIFAEASHTFELSDVTQLMPYVGLVYQQLRTSGFTENGSFAALQRGSDHINQTSTVVGLRGQWRLPHDVNLFADLGWQHYYNGTTADTSMHFIGGSDFNIRASSISQDSALIGLGATFELQPNMSLRVGYTGEYSNRSQDHGAAVLWEIEF